MTKQFIFIVILFVSITAFSQEKTINLWSGPVPGSIENPDWIETTDSNNGWTKTRLITNPRLDFYPAKPDENNGTAVVICPGGGYWGIAIDHEGKQTAEWLNSMGISAFVLKYRLPDDAIMIDQSIGPLQDAQEAIRLVRRNAKELHINPNKIGIMGYSAGGHLASTLSTHFNEKVYQAADTTSARPDFSLLIYPVISMDAAITHAGSRLFLLGEDPSEEQVKCFSNELQVNAQTPPAFMVHSLDDQVVPVQNSMNYALAMKKFNVHCELHIYEQGGHGYGLGRSANTESSWPVACKLWLKSRGFL
ncbi:MAG: alpha/beta hydrolase [Prolixibacteraceae bacterium]|nr:alpha/beta hydrolase [Prolixibacteraceae bacterium]